MGRTGSPPLVDLRLGDCLEVMKTLPDGYVDAVVTDPPYGVGIEYASFDDTRENVQMLLSAFIPEAVRVAKGAVLFPSGGFPTEVWLYQNFPPKWRLCWYKGAQTTLSAVGFNDWEAIFAYGNVHRQCHDYFWAPTAKADNGHPCPKSIRWASWLVQKFSDEGATVLDPFMGSGTTGVACVQTGRNFIGIEIDPGYFEVAKRRIGVAQMQMRLGI